MKCLCGLNEKPDNLLKLRSHVRICITERLPLNEDGYFIVWRDKELSVVGTKEENERVFDNITLPEKEEEDSLESSEEIDSSTETSEDSSEA